MMTKTKTWLRSTAALSLMILSLTCASAYAGPPLDPEIGGLIKEANARIDATDRKLVMVTAERDSINIELWKCGASKPSPKGTFDNFETGVVIGAGLSILIMFAVASSL